jgi:non-ribosomal peptide synthetase component F
MWDVNPLGERILSQAAAGHGNLVADRAGSLDRSGLAGVLASDARQLRLAGRREAPVVAAMLPLGAVLVRTLLACVVHDLSLVIIDPAAPEARRASVLEGVQPDVVVTAHGLTGAGPRAESPLHGRPPGYVAVSSGSTGGAAKGVLSQWGNVDQFVRAGAESLHLDAGAVWAEPTHLSYDMPMTNVLVALAAGAGVRLGSAVDALRPLRFIGQVAATHVRLAPRSVELVGAERRAAPHSLRVWACGGDRLKVGHVLTLHDLGVPRVVNTYGTSETIGFASSADFRPGDAVPEEYGSATVGTGSVGQWSLGSTDVDGDSMLTVRAPWLPTGYAFGTGRDGYPRWLEPGVVLTGDLGVELGGRFYCLGRAGRRVKRSGLFVDLDEVDATIEAAVGHPTHTVLARGGELVTLVEGRPSGDLKAALAAVLAPERLPDRFVPVGGLPRLGNGKVDLRGARLIAEDGGPAEPAAVDRSGQPRRDAM